MAGGIPTIVGYGGYDGKYIYSFNAPYLYQINPKTLAVVASFDSGVSGAQGVGFTFDGTYVYLLLSPVIYKIDPASMSQVDNTTIPNTTASTTANNMIYDGTYIYFITVTVIYQIDPATLATINTLSAPTGYFDGGTYDGSYLYIGWENSTASTYGVYQVSPETMKIVASASLPTNPLSMIYDGISIYAASTTAIYQIDPASMSVVNSLSIANYTGTAVVGLAFDGKYLYVEYNPTSAQITLYKLNPKTLTTVSSLTIALAPPYEALTGNNFLIVPSLKYAVSWAFP